MKSLLATVCCFASVFVSAEYPKPITLIVTKITRERRPTGECGTCGYLTTVEAHSPTARFTLVCESYWVPRRPENNSVCAQFETGVHEAQRLEADLISFWPENFTSGPGIPREFYSVVEETRLDQN